MATIPSEESDHEYDVIVIGAGPVGENVADRAVQGGLTAVIVESELVGGECSYWACMPSKALLRTGSVLRAARAVAGAREAVEGALDVAAVLKRRDKAAANWSDAGQVRWLESAGIDLVRGHGRIAGVRRVEVTTPQGETIRLRARHGVAVCTGSSAALPDVPGLAGSSPWSSREATSSPTVPGRLVIIGGGVVAAEMATAYSDLGSEVTMVVRSGLLGGAEPFAGELVSAALEGRGVRILTGVSPIAVSRTEYGLVTVDLDSGESLDAEELLVATGRAPRTEDLGLASVGLVDGEWLEVDETLRVLGAEEDGGAPWLFAAGDVNHRVLLTHQGKYQARALGDLLAARAAGGRLDTGAWGAHAATADRLAVPQVTFTDPEVASAGLTAAQAEAQGFRTRVVDYEIGHVAGATVHASRYTGTARLVVDEDRRVVIGATFVGQDVAELLHSATVAIAGEVPIDRLWHAVPSYPTISEVWLRLLEEYGRGSAVRPA